MGQGTRKHLPQCPKSGVVAQQMTLDWASSRTQTRESWLQSKVSDEGRVGPKSDHGSARTTKEGMQGIACETTMTYQADLGLFDGSSRTIPRLCVGENGGVARICIKRQMPVIAHYLALACRFNTVPQHTSCHQLAPLQALRRHNARNCPPSVPVLDICLQSRFYLY